MGFWIIHAETLHFICLHETTWLPKHCCDLWIPQLRPAPAQSFFMSQLMQPPMSCLFPCSSRPEYVCFVLPVFLYYLGYLWQWDIRIFEQIVSSNPMSTLVSPESTPCSYSTEQLFSQKYMSLPAL